MATVGEVVQEQLGRSSISHAAAGHSGLDIGMEAFEPDTPTAVSVLAASFPASRSRKRRRGVGALSTGEAALQAVGFNRIVFPGNVGMDHQTAKQCLCSG
jgi:hypothetical protein